MVKIISIMKGGNIRNLWMLLSSSSLQSSMKVGTFLPAFFRLRAAKPERMEARQMTMKATMATMVATAYSRIC